MFCFSYKQVIRKKKKKVLSSIELECRFNLLLLYILIRVKKKNFFSHHRDDECNLYSINKSIKKQFSIENMLFSLFHYCPNKKKRKKENDVYLSNNGGTNLAFFFVTFFFVSWNNNLCSCDD